MRTNTIKVVRVKNIMIKIYLFCFIDPGKLGDPASRKWAPLINYVSSRSISILMKQYFFTKY